MPQNRRAAGHHTREPLKPSNYSPQSFASFAEVGQAISIPGSRHLGTLHLYTVTRSGNVERANATVRAAAVRRVAEMDSDGVLRYFAGVEQLACEAKPLDDQRIHQLAAQVLALQFTPDRGRA